MEKNIKDLIARVNRTLVWYKKGGWIDCRRTPNGGENMIQTMDEYVESRFNRESWDVPELQKAVELLDGHLFKCSLTGINLQKKKYKEATVTIIEPEEIKDPSPEVLQALIDVEKFLGGKTLKFTSLIAKVKYTVEKI